MNFWKTLYKVLEKGEKAVLLYVMESTGSSPGRQGFKMLVSEKGEMIGSIGGGIMEHKLIELSKSLLEKGPFKPFLKKQIHRADLPENKSGMICSGEQSIVFYYMDKKILGLVLELSEYQKTMLHLTEGGIFFDNQKMNKHFDFKTEGDQWHFRESIEYKNYAYVIGGGHVGCAVCKMMRQLNFWVKQYDDREDLNTMIQNEYANEKYVINYNEIDQYVYEGENIYVIIVTFGYRSDEICIRQLLGKSFKYFGVMGSQAKMDKLLANLKSDGLPQSDIDKIYTPIGIPIHSKTPEEIAVSIAAQIIQVKNAP